MEINEMITTTLDLTNYIAKCITNKIFVLDL